MGEFVIERQQPSTFVDNRNEPVQGFLVQGRLLPWDEPFNLQVVSLSPDIVKPLLEQLVEDREALEALSTPPDEE